MGNLLLLLWVERKEENINEQSNLISRRSPKKKAIYCLGMGRAIIVFLCYGKENKGNLRKLKNT